MTLWLGLLSGVLVMTALLYRVAARWLRAALPLKIQLNMLVIEDVAHRLYPGKREDEARNEASFIVSNSTYEMIDKLSKAVEDDVRAARGGGSAQ